MLKVFGFLIYEHNNNPDDNDQLYLQAKGN